MNIQAEKCFCQGMDLLALASTSHAEPEFRRLKAGEVAWDSSTSDGKIIVVKEGSVRVYHGSNESRPRLAHLIGAGHWFGIESLAGIRGTSHAVAAEPTMVAVLDAGQVIEQALVNPKYGRELIKHLAEQSVAMSDEITQLRTQDCTTQVAHALLRLARCGGATRSGEGNHVTLQITQQDVADAVGIARETVNAMIQKLAEAGVIQKQRGRISFDPATLARTIDASSVVSSN